jgi:hypothetical protein
MKTNPTTSQEFPAVRPVQSIQTQATAWARALHPLPAPAPLPVRCEQERKAHEYARAELLTCAALFRGRELDPACLPFYRDFVAAVVEYLRAEEGTLGA